jgi:flavin reductase (DIM6/NTAB) family NADH-FMN oxidoreductase RutF
MTEKRKLGPCVTFFPHPTTLLSTRGADRQVDIMTASWVGIVSKTPPTMAVSLARGRQTYANIRETGCFAVNMVPARLVVEADYCGLKSGRDEDKVEGAGLTLVEASLISSPLIDESPLNVECRYVQEVELGEYRLVLGEILEIHAAGAAFDEEGKMDARVFDPLVYFGGIREYWSLGEKVAQAYQEGKKLFR